MTKSGLPKSVRKFIRLQKSLIRKRFSGMEEQKEKIYEMYQILGIKYQKNHRTLEEKNKQPVGQPV